MSAAPSESSNAPSGRSRPIRAEVVLLLLVAAAGIGLRVAFPGRIAVEHFDEGVYASNLWFESGGYPQRHLYAPPFFPWLVEWSVIVAGPSGWGPIVPSLLFGSLMVPLLWWVGRSWFGPEAGLAAAVLAAFSDVHILYSRTALVDVTFSFWLLLAVYFAGESFRNPHRGAILAAGLAGGLAWATKYNGWLALAIPLGGLLLWLMIGKQRRRAHGSRPVGSGTIATPAGGLLVNWLQIAAITATVWAPVWFALREHGGYGAVAAHHRQYLVGFAGWWDSLTAQFLNLRPLDGWPSWLGLGLAVVLPPVTHCGRERFTWNAVRLAASLVAAVSLAAAGALIGTAVVLGICGVVSAGALLTRSNSDRRSPAAWILGVWFLGLLAATAFYHPYPRLMVPWLVSAWLAVGAGVGLMLRSLAVTRADGSHEHSARPVMGIAGLFLLGVLAVIWRGGSPADSAPSAWQDRTGLQRIARQIRREMAQEAHGSRPVGLGSRPVGLDSVVYTYAEPALFHHLRAQQVVSGPIGALSFADRRTGRPRRTEYLAVGPHAERDPSFERQWRLYGHRFRLVGRYRYQPSDLVLLNQSPAAGPLFGKDRGRAIRLYVVE